MRRKRREQILFLSKQKKKVHAACLKFTTRSWLTWPWWYMAKIKKETKARVWGGRVFIRKEWRGSSGNTYEGIRERERESPPETQPRREEASDSFCATLYYTKCLFFSSMSSGSTANCYLFRCVLFLRFEFHCERELARGEIFEFIRFKQLFKFSLLVPWKSFLGNETGSFVILYGR